MSKVGSGDTLGIHIPPQGPKTAPAGAGAVLVAIASGTRRASARCVPAHLPTHVREPVLSALCNYEPSNDGRELKKERQT